MSEQAERTARFLREPNAYPGRQWQLLANPCPPASASTRPPRRRPTTHRSSPGCGVTLHACPVLPKAAWGVTGRLKPFRNFDEDRTPIARAITLPIDSEQLDAGEALEEFRSATTDEIDRFRRALLERGQRSGAEAPTDEDLIARP